MTSYGNHIGKLQLYAYIYMQSLHVSKWFDRFYSNWKPRFLGWWCIIRIKNTILRNQPCAFNQVHLNLTGEWVNQDGKGKKVPPFTLQSVWFNPLSTAGLNTISDWFISWNVHFCSQLWYSFKNVACTNLHMRLFFRTPLLIGSKYDRLFLLTNRQVVSWG